MEPRSKLAPSVLIGALTCCTLGSALFLCSQDMGSTRSSGARGPGASRHHVAAERGASEGRSGPAPRGPHAAAPRREGLDPRPRPQRFKIRVYLRQSTWNNSPLRDAKDLTVTTWDPHGRRSTFTVETDAAGDWWSEFTPETKPRMARVEWQGRFSAPQPIPSSRWQVMAFLEEVRAKAWVEVLDTRGNPVPNAQVLAKVQRGARTSVREPTDLPLQYAPPSPEGLVTDAAGRVLLVDVPAGDVVFRARSGSSWGVTFARIAPPGGEPPTVTVTLDRLQPRGDLTLLVRAADPVRAGGEASVQFFDGTWLDDPLPLNCPTLLQDVPYRGTLRVQSRGHHSVQTDLDLELPGPHQLIVDLPLEAPETTIHVLAPGGRPVSGGTLELSGPTNLRASIQQGAARVRLPAGATPWRCLVQADGYCPWETQVAQSPTPLTLRLPAGACTTLQAKVPGGGVGPSPIGREWSGRAVAVELPGRSFSANLDADGVLRIPGVTGELGTISLCLGDLETPRHRFALDGGVHAFNPFGSGGLACLRLRVLDAGGEAVTGPLRWNLRDFTPDASGMLRLSVGAGPTQLTLISEDEGVCDVAIAPLGAGEERELTVRLRPGARLEGAKPWPSAEVRIRAWRRDPPLYVNAKLSADRFRFPPLPPGDYTVQAEFPSGAAGASCSVTVGATDQLDVRLVPE